MRCGEGTTCAMRSGASVTRSCWKRQQLRGGTRSPTQQHNSRSNAQAQAAIFAMCLPGAHQTEALDTPKHTSGASHIKGARSASGV